MTIKNFRDFGIRTEYKGFEGEKIHLKKVLNKEIEVHRCKIEKSKFPGSGNGNRLDMEIVVDGVKRVLWTSSVVLQEMIEKLPTNAFPFRTTIVEENQRLEFT